MNDLKRITIEELRECYVVVYTQEEVDLLRKLGVDSIITYRNGGMCIGPMLNNDNATLGNHTIFRHANFIGCLSADKIKMPVRKYFCFNIPVYRNMAEEPSCRSPYHEEYIQTSVSGNSEGLCRSTYSFLSERR